MDFNVDPVKIYGIWPLVAEPVEVSIYGVCSNGCGYCFSNLNRAAAERDPEKHRKNPIEKVIRGLERAMNDPKDPIGFFLRERYPVALSNTTDPFMKEEKTFRCTDAFLRWAKKRDVPVHILTKGTLLADPEEFDRYAELLAPGRNAVYLTLTTLDPEISRVIEPGAPLPADRLEICRKLADRGIPVELAANPFLGDWCQDRDAYLKAAKDAGARAVFIDFLHFSTSQMGQLSGSMREYASKANLFPRLIVGELKKWFRSAAVIGIPISPPPEWETYFGMMGDRRGRYREWYSRPWTAIEDFHRHLAMASTDGKDAYNSKTFELENRGNPVVFSWGALRDFLEDSGVPNPVLKVSPFWIPFNSNITADCRGFKAKLGKEAPLYEILRYFFNHPWDNTQTVWTCAMVQAMKDFEQEIMGVTEAGDIVCVYDPANRMAGVPYHDVKKFEKNGEKYAILNGR